MKTKKKTIEYYMSLPYKMEIIPDVEEGGFTAWFPDLPGCITCGNRIVDVVANAQDAKKTWLMAALEDGIEILEPSEEAPLEDYSGQFKLRMHKSLPKSLAINAKREGISMNQYCNYLLTMNDAVHSSRKDKNNAM